MASILLLVFIICLRVDGYEGDISMKFASILMILMVVSTAGSLNRWKRSFRWIFLVLLVLLLPGLWTAGLDIANASDITNRRFTYYLPTEEAAVLNWGKRNLPADAVVQNFPPARMDNQEGNISVVPTFMNRSTAVGDWQNGRAFLISDADYYGRIDLLKGYHSDVDTHKAEIRQLGIQYLFWGQPETQYFHYTPHLKRLFSRGNTILFSLE